MVSVEEFGNHQFMFYEFMMKWSYVIDWWWSPAFPSKHVWSISSDDVTAYTDTEIEGDEQDSNYRYED